MKVNIKARIKRNLFNVVAGSAFRDQNDEIIKQLNSMNKKALVGIQREDGTYTIVGEESIHYLTPLGVTGEIPLADFLVILHENGMRLGKTGDFEYININDQDKVWLKDPQTMNAMWNTMLLLDNANRNSKD